MFYQVYPRSFADSDGDVVGDLDGVAARLDYLEQLGVDAIWLNPVTVSPMADHGYDVADPRDVDPLFGGLDALDRMIAGAHQRGIKVTMDLVPNHTSSQHPWFQAGVAAGPGGQRERYIFRDGRGPGMQLPDFRLKANLANDFFIDRERQKAKTFAGIDGVNTQDVALQEGMGPVVDRAREHLGTSDRAIIVMRQLMLEATYAVEAGKLPRGADPASYRNVRALDHMIPQGAVWREVLAPELLAKF